ncbi:hypothetical protein ABBQ32_005304 [Trebouxia sp. C0010 RCD-2024]
MTATVPLAVPATNTSATEYFDVLNEIGAKTGIVKARNHVHRDGDWHRAVHIWVYVQSTGHVLIQKRAACKDSWPNLWDISAAGHVTAGDQSLVTAQRETSEELGIDAPMEAIEPLFSMQAAFNSNDESFVNNEFIDVYLLTLKEEIPVQAFVLQQEEVAAVRYIPIAELEQCWRNNDDSFVVPDCESEYMELFQILYKRDKDKDHNAKVVLGQVGSTRVELVCWQS